MGAPPAPARQAGNEVGKEVCARRGDRQRRPDHGLYRQRQPSRNRESDKGRRDEAAAQIVEYLPAIERRKLVGVTRAVAAGCGSAQPGCKLPVAPNPAKGAAGICEIVGGEVLVEDDVAGKCGTTVKPLEQIMADDRVLRYAAMQASIAARRRHSKVKAAAMCRDVMERLSLTHLVDKHVGVLAHGQRQWVELAMVVALEPKLILLDEPAAGMTADETNKTAALIREVNKSAAIVVVEHDMQFIKQIAQTVTVFHQGRILVEDTMENVQGNPIVREVYLGHDDDD